MVTAALLVWRLSRLVEEEEENDRELAKIRMRRKRRLQYIRMRQMAQKREEEAIKKDAIQSTQPKEDNTIPTKDLKSTSLSEKPWVMKTKESES